MDSYFTIPGIQLPFQRRLSRLYNDTKKSSDFVKEPVQNAEDPEIKALHRKLRIQKDRLVSWGLEWSDPSQSSEVLIDSSLSRAGLSEVVGSIMSTIKETLAEVEPLWLSSKQLVGGGGNGSGGGGSTGGGLGKASEAQLSSSDKAIAAAADRERDRDRKQPIVTWDKARFADLVRDLTVSIDTLYDLSRTRASAATASSGSSSGLGGADSKSGTAGKPTLTSSASWSPSYPKQHSILQAIQQAASARHEQAQSPSSTRQQTGEEARMFTPSHMLVPQQIDSAMLTIIESVTRPPEEPKVREVVFMNKQAYADLVARPMGQSYSPLLLEYAYFDPVYSSTGIMLPMTRFEKLSTGLGLFQGEDQRLLHSRSGNPRLLGYFEDMAHCRLGLVYQFPVGFHAIASSESATQSPATLRSCLYSLGDLLGSPGFEPKLEAKFRLASNLANAVFEVHAKGIAHGNLVDSSILFGRTANPDASLPASDVSQVDIRKPLISSFDLFPNTPSQGKSDIKRRSSRLHQHPLNPVSFAPGAPPIVDADPRVFDLYSLAMLLLSIGMWTRLENLVPHQDSAMVSEAVLEQLSTQCGTLYMKAVQTCWNAMELVMSAGKDAGDSHLARLQVRASSYLEACCVLDDVGKLEERLHNDLGGDDIAVSQAPTPTPAQTQTAVITTKTRSAPPPLPPLKIGPPPAPLSMPPQMRARGLLDNSRRERFQEDFGSGNHFDHKPPPVPPKTGSFSGPQQTPLTPQAEVVAAATPRQQPTDAPAKERARMRLYPQVPLPPDVIEKWHSFVMPQVNHALRHFYRSHPESVEISLESVGDSPRNTRPTVVVVCMSVAKVRGILKRKLGTIFEGSNGIGLKVCTGRVMRSRKESDSTVGAAAIKRSQAGGYALPGCKSITAANGQFQQQPQNGASIGAWIGDRHLPPVSFGGLVLVDDKPFGMTVHHMLDDPDATEAAAARESHRVLRSTGAAGAPGTRADGGEGREGEEGEEEQIEELGRSVLDWYAELQADSSAANSSSSEDDGDDDYACEFSDTSSSVSESDITSEWSDSDNEDHDVECGDGGEDDGEEKAEDAATEEPGDLPGVEPGYGEGYIVTQPALDDVDGNFYPDEATQDDDHLDSCGLGDVYASSGVRRRVDEHGLVHEIDWALFEFHKERQPLANSIPHLPLANHISASTTSTDTNNLAGALHPTTVAPASSLPGLEVQCMARTSGLQTGRILPTITSVKIYGRTSPSHTYQISAAGVTGVTDSGEDGASGGHARPPKSKAASHPIGIPGDSGAWIVEREHGRLCGHVLAWSARKRVAYLCPMDVLLLDIAETLEAGEVRLPGGEAIVKIMDPEERGPREELVAEEAAATASSSGAGDTARINAMRRRPSAVAAAGHHRAPVSRGTSSLSLPGSWAMAGGVEAGIASSPTMTTLEGEDGAEEGFQDAVQMTASASASASATTDGAGGQSRWKGVPTKMMEIVGSMGKVRLDQGGGDVRAPC